MNHPTVKSDKRPGRRLETHITGSLLGCAIGDAVGEVAFRLPAKDDWRQALQREETLIYTDDTAMTIGLTETLIRWGGIDQQALGDRFADNFRREPWRGYGPGPPEVLIVGREHKRSYVELARALYSGAGSFGNGAAMRIAPVGLVYRDREDVREAAERAAEVTHAHPIGRDACVIQALAVGIALRHALTARDLEPVSVARHLEEACRTPELQTKMRAVADLLERHASPSEVADAVGRTVAAHESVPFAIYAFLAAPKDFEACVEIAIFHGGDRDTLGAMAGAISGAYLGEDALPASWRTRVENADMLRQLGHQLTDAFPDT